METIYLFLLSNILIALLIYIYNYQKNVRVHIDKTDEMYELIKEIHLKILN
uniref:Uncharacterized protein n=1 Tax=viral metagenome TaxID=1070528 RepID=A0A6C0CPW2_9ZZZZ